MSKRLLTITKDRPCQLKDLTNKTLNYVCHMLKLTATILAFTKSQLSVFPRFHLTRKNGTKESFADI